MRKIDLNQYGVRLFRCKMIAHDYLWFASFDVSGVALTERVVHNYALSYALNRYDRGLMKQSPPEYEKDLSNMDIYATPAWGYQVATTTFTYNALDTKTLRTDALEKRNTPKLGKKTMIDPGSQFSFYIFTLSNQPPGLIRLGKKRSPMRLNYWEMSNPVAIFSEKEVLIDHLVNPLDLQGDIVQFRPIQIPPFLILADIKVKNDWVIKLGPKYVHLPVKIFEKVCKNEN
ncbi:MAG: type I-D CRISPR-associated protein Cas5/Csc1 [Halanaerobiales bacterium]|nr:type I-D CRISPR-associated protein Cas5/Csc1 [Halanaerobiales bacterium]